MKIIAAVLLWPLVKLFGCPCCGPRWYARLMVWVHRLLGEPLPPELEGWA